MTKHPEFFSLDDTEAGIARQLADGLTARIFPGDQAMISIVDAAPNSEGTMHRHPEEQWGVLLRGSGVRTQDGKDIAVSAGDFWRTPGGVMHAFRAGPEGARVLDIFSPPRAEYRTSGSGYGSE